MEKPVDLIAKSTNADSAPQQPYVSENTNKPFEFGKNGEFCPPNFADKMNERKANP